MPWLPRRNKEGLIISDGNSRINNRGLARRKGIVEEEEEQEEEEEGEAEREVGGGEEVSRWRRRKRKGRVVGG